MTYKLGPFGKISHFLHFSTYKLVTYLEPNMALLVCVCERERERGASVTQQPSLSIRSSLTRSHATHASTRTF